MAVMLEVFTDRAIEGREGRSKANRPTSSAAMCYASAALPPLPKRRILFPGVSALTKSSQAWARVVRTSIISLIIIRAAIQEEDAVSRLGGCVVQRAGSVNRNCSRKSGGRHCRHDCRGIGYPAELGCFGMELKERAKCVACRREGEISRSAKESRGISRHSLRVVGGRRG